VRDAKKALQKEFEKTEEDLKALQVIPNTLFAIILKTTKKSVGQIIGDVLKQLDEERCNFLTIFVLLTLLAAVIVKASSGPRYVVGCRNRVNKSKLVPGTRVALDMTTLTIMRILPRFVFLSNALS
jgi:26S proteasome regulatory subunit T4